MTNQREMMLGVFKNKTIDDLTNHDITRLADLLFSTETYHDPYFIDITVLNVPPESCSSTEGNSGSSEPEETEDLEDQPKVMLSPEFSSMLFSIFTIGHHKKCDLFDTLGEQDYFEHIKGYFRSIGIDVLLFDKHRDAEGNIVNIDIGFYKL